MKTVRAMLLPVLTFFCVILVSCTRPAPAPATADAGREKEVLTEVIKASIGWALTKDTSLLYRIMAKDSLFLVINPENDSFMIGFEALRKVTEEVWMDPRFEATEMDVRDLRIRLSQDGSVAWYSCFLDDKGTWDGREMGWDNVRWTGVLEKRDGQWVHVQQHFSYPADRFPGEL